MKEKNSTKFTIGKIGVEWLFFNKNSLKKSSLENYTYLFEKHIFKSDLADNSIKEISAEDIVHYSESLLFKGLSPKTVNCVLLILNSIFKYAKEMFGVTPPRINYVKDIKRETRVLSPAEQSRLEIYIRKAF